MGTKTLRELCNELGVSRRAIQGYEKNGLVKFSAKNERGYLLYDDETQKKIQVIYRYQRFGFKVKEIGELLKTPQDRLKQRLEQQLCVMREQKKNMDSAIQEIIEMINKL